MSDYATLNAWKRNAIMLHPELGELSDAELAVKGKAAKQSRQGKPKAAPRARARNNNVSAEGADAS